MSDPIRDNEELFAVASSAYDAVEYGDLGAPKYQIDWECMGADETELRWKTAIIAVRDAVCPEGHRVVPAAEHDALMSGLAEWRRSEGPTGLNIGALYDKYRTALATEPAL